MAQWQAVTQSRNGAQIADVVGLADRRMLFQLGQPGIFSASMRVNDPKARRDILGGLAPGQHEMKLYRDGVAVETVFQLAKVDISGSVDTMRLGFEWQGIASYLQDALVYPQSPVTTAYSGSTLPWTWISAYQARTGGSLGITQGIVLGSAATRTKSITQEANLFSTINELASTGNQFDWAIDENRTYREWHSQRGYDRGLVLEPGVNVAEWSYSEAVVPGEVVTDLRVQGPPGTQQVSASDATARGLYGRREASITLFADYEPSSVTTGALQSHADAAMAARVSPVIIPQIRLSRNHASVEWGAYWLGDVAVFRVRVGDYDWINAPYRIVQIEIALDANDNETVTLGVNAL